MPSRFLQAAPRPVLFRTRGTRGPKYIGVRKRRKNRRSVDSHETGCPFRGLHEFTVHPLCPEQRTPCPFQRFAPQGHNQKKSFRLQPGKPEPIVTMASLHYCTVFLVSGETVPETIAHVTGARMRETTARNDTWQPGGGRSLYHRPMASAAPIGRSPAALPSHVVR